MMSSSAYNRFGVLMGISWPASCPRWYGLREDSLPMITLFPSQGDFCATAEIPFVKVEAVHEKLVKQRIEPTLEDTRRASTAELAPALRPYISGGHELSEGRQGRYADDIGKRVCAGQQDKASSLLLRTQARATQV